MKLQAAKPNTREIVLITPQYLQIQPVLRRRNDLNHVKSMTWSAKYGRSNEKFDADVNNLKQPVFN